MRERILKAVIEEIQQRGMKFTVDDVTRRLGISKKTIYEYFSSKEEIIETIVERIVEETNEKSNEIINDYSLSIIEKVRNVLNVLPEYYQVYDRPILEEMKRYYPDQWVKIDASLTDDWDELKNLIEEGMDQGEIISKYAAPVIMRVLIEGINTTLDQRFFLNNNLTVTEALADIVDILFYGLIPEDKR